jgi:hypothetical protein
MVLSVQEWHAEDVFLRQIKSGPLQNVVGDVLVLAAATGAGFNEPEETSR